MKKINLNFEINSKKIFFFISSIFFIYLLYLSIPSLYDTGRVQKDIIKKLNQDFNLNFSLSTDIRYRIVPKPHFVIKDCELIQFDSNIANRIAEIQDLKIYIKQTNFFNKEIKIKDIHLSNSNFFFSKSNIDYIKNFFDKKFSQKEIEIKKSKIFFKDKSDEVIFIYSIKDIKAFYKKEKNRNDFVMHGELFNIDNKVQWSKNFDTKKRVTSINANKIFLNLKNEVSFFDNEPHYQNTIEIMSNKFKTNYKINKNNISFFSEKSLIKNTIINYKGIVDLNPFNFSLKINSKKINLDYFFKNLNLFNEILTSKILFKQNLYGQIKIQTENIQKGKIFNEAELIFNFQGGEINLNDSVLMSKELGTLNISESGFVVNNNKLVFEGKSKLKIKNLNYFYKIFLTPKKNRIDLTSIDFFFDVDPKNGQITIKKVLLYDNENKVFKTKLVSELLQQYEDNQFSYLNYIKFKNFFNDFLINLSYEG